MTEAEKLDEISSTLTDVRLAMATLHGEVIALVKSLDASSARSEQVHVDHEQRIRDIERVSANAVTGLREADTRASDTELRLRAVERRLWTLPSIGTVIAVASLFLEIYFRLTP